MGQPPVFLDARRAPPLASDPLPRPHWPNHESASLLSFARFAVGVVLATLIALAARRVGALSRSGSLSAAAVGTAAVLGGWSWAALLLAYFLSSVALTRFRASAKAARTDSIIAKGGPRDAVQVLANGLVFALAAVSWLLTEWDGWRAVGAGALAAAASDTWATEIGVLAGHAPRSILSWRSVPPGTSGGVSAPGVGAAFAGSAFIAMLAFALGWPGDVVLATFAGGLAGSTFDSLLGASVQQRRRCDRCNAATERFIHVCGTPSRIVGGVPWVDNDAVNALSTVAGGLLGLLVVA